MKYISIDKILPNPYQPRRTFSTEELGELAKSIQQYGVIEPLILRVNSQGNFELIAGERRLRAAKLAGLKEVPSIIKSYSDSMSAQIALIENLQRSDLSPIEEAQAYQKLISEFCLIQEDIARKVSKSRSHIANTLRLLKLCTGVQTLLLQGQLTMGQAKPLVTIKDPQLQLNLAHTIIEKGLSARQVESLVRKSQQELPKVTEPATKGEMSESKYLTYLRDTLQQQLGTAVHFRPGKEKSKIEIEYYSDEDLERLIDLLTQQQKTKQTTINNKDFVI